jgi:glycosyltransferase involved in cell wall biosynthesis
MRPPVLNEVAEPVIRSRTEAGIRWPDILVVIPALAAGETLPGCLEQLRRSTGFEKINVVIVHDAEERQSFEADDEAFCVREICSDKSHNAGAARNFGARMAREGIIVFLDADVLVEREALARLVAPILAGHAEAAVGNYSEDVRGLSFLQAYKQLYIWMVYSRRRGLIRNEFWTGIGAIRADVFHQVGGFHAHFGGARGETPSLVND